jgi:hypothetical protein
MGTASAATYTAKLLDGPLEGKTITTEFLESGDPRPRLEIPASAGKSYIYARGSGLEFESNDNPEQPSAVDYRYIEAVFE